MDEFKNIYTSYTSLKAMRARYMPLWEDISKYVGISVQPMYLMNANSNKSQQLDEFVDDPTSAISVNQAGDYLCGIMWGTGEKVVQIVPSRYVLEHVDKAVVSDYFDYISDQTLYHMNHAEAGYSTALKPYAYDQFSFGTSGVGTFPNNDFKQRIADNALIFRNYGVDNTCIEEGKSGVVDTVYATYHWKASRIVGEFCMENGKVSLTLVNKLPKAIKDAFNKQDHNQEFTIVCGAFPRDNYDPKLKGKRGARYRGVWFMEEGAVNNNIFYEEDYEERPISMSRMIRVRGETYGRSSGTMLISSIKSVNFMLSEVIEIIEKMNNPSLGMWNNAIMGDNVLDTSSDGLTIFNQALLGGASTPVFPIADIGDPSAIIQFLLPYLNDKITTAFKVDALLDFNSAKDMTATESLQRYAIRGKSLAGLLLQQKNERLIPDVRRSISILMKMGELGANPRTQEALVNQLKENKRDARIIPDAVLRVMEEGRPWYELRWNNELEKLVRTEAVQNLLQILNAITAIAAVYPDIIDAIDWYKLLKEINDNLDANNKLMYSETDFKNKIAQKAKERAAALAIQAGQAGSEINKNQSTANKNNEQAKVAQNGG